MHGTAIAGSDDRDEMGIALEPAAFVTGVARLEVTDPAGRTHRRAFEQFEAHTARDRAGGLDERSGAGDLAARLDDLRTTSPLPEQPDRAWVDGWLHRGHLRCWDAPLPG